MKLHTPACGSHRLWAQARVGRKSQVEAELVKLRAVHRRANLLRGEKNHLRVLSEARAVLVSAVSHDGSCFRASVVREAVTSLLLGSRPAYPHRVFGTLEKAVFFCGMGLKYMGLRLTSMWVRRSWDDDASGGYAACRLRSGAAVMIRFGCVVVEHTDIVSTERAVPEYLSLLDLRIRGVAM